MFPLPTRRPCHPYRSLRRALTPPILLWLACAIALAIPAALAPALAADGLRAPAAGRALDPPGGIRTVAGRAATAAPSHQAGGARAARAAAPSRVPRLWPPVEGPLVRGFEELAGPFGPGHRGVDFGAAPGAPVRASASGRVTFAGLVAGTTWVSIQVAPGVLVSVGPLRTLEASAGRAAATGDRLGTLAGGHAGAGPGVAALHLSLRVDGTYVDPLPWLAGLAHPRLVPLPDPGGPH